MKIYFNKGIITRKIFLIETPDARQYENSPKLVQLEETPKEGIPGISQGANSDTKRTKVGEWAEIHEHLNASHQYDIISVADRSHSPQAYTLLPKMIPYM